MRELNEQNIPEAVIETLAATKDPRLKTIMTALVKHLHGFVREVELNEQEWMSAVEFLTELGKKDEFILASDTLGVSILVDAINHRKPEGATESSVLGPFYLEGVPEKNTLGNIAEGSVTEPTFVTGRVTDPAGKPLEGALLDIWQTAEDGLYDLQHPDFKEFNLRGKFLTDKEGRYAFRTVMPRSYGIPIGGPVGRMFKALGRHHFRPAHIHFKVSADGYVPLTTMIFPEGADYLDSDAVFGVKGSLVTAFVRHDTDGEVEGISVKPPYYTVHYDFGLKPAEKGA